MRSIDLDRRPGSNRLRPFGRSTADEQEDNEDAGCESGDHGLGANGNSRIRSLGVPRVHVPEVSPYQTGEIRTTFALQSRPRHERNSTVARDTPGNIGSIDAQRQSTSYDKVNHFPSGMVTRLFVGSSPTGRIRSKALQVSR
jgi:hypothetical protein